MPLDLDEVVEMTRDLPPDVVAELVDRIWAARFSTRPEVEKAWKDEVNRRIAEIESGQVEGIPGEEVSARIRKKLGR